jgi:hypothetical protein
MFGRKVEKDPQKALDQANKMLNNPLMKGLNKVVMGQDFVDQTNNALAQAQNAIDMQKQFQNPEGMEATAVVTAIQDTGKTINDNPVVVLTLTINAAYGGAIPNVAGETIVSRLAIPRVGDTIKIKYNPANPMQFSVVS